MFRCPAYINQCMWQTCTYLCAGCISTIFHVDPLEMLTLIQDGNYTQNIVIMGFRPAVFPHYNRQCWISPLLGRS